MEVKKPGPEVEAATVRMDFALQGLFRARANVGYETLLYDVMIGDATLFNRADMVEDAWRVVQPIIDAWKSGTPAIYKAGAPGPKQADELLAREGRHWAPGPGQRQDVVTPTAVAWRAEHGWLFGANGTRGRERRHLGRKSQINEIIQGVSEIFQLSACFRWSCYAGGVERQRALEALQRRLKWCRCQPWSSSTGLSRICGRAMTMHYDIIVIGSGPGGGALAQSLAPTGKKILMLERGGYLPREQRNWDSKAVFVDGLYQTKETWYEPGGSTFHLACTAGRR